MIRKGIMKKKVFSMFIAFAVVMAMLPVMTATAGSEYFQYVSFGDDAGFYENVYFGTGNKSGSGWAWNEGTATLTVSRNLEFIEMGVEGDTEAAEFAAFMRTPITIKYTANVTINCIWSFYIDFTVMGTGKSGAKLTAYYIETYEEAYLTVKDANIEIRASAGDEWMEEIAAFGGMLSIVDSSVVFRSGNYESACFLYASGSIFISNSNIYIPVQHSDATIVGCGGITFSGKCNVVAASGICAYAYEAYGEIIFDLSPGGRVEAGPATRDTFGFGAVGVWYTTSSTPIILSTNNEIIAPYDGEVQRDGASVYNGRIGIAMTYEEATRVVIANMVGRLPGDANEDDKITALDATMILRFVNWDASRKPFINLLNADVNADTKVTSLDATLILRFVNWSPGRKPLLL